VSTTPFERYGGFAKVRKIVSTFYEYILADETVSPYFDDVDMKRLIDHQSKFISSMMGGPGSFTDDHLERVHARLGITRAAFGVASGLLKEAMEDNGVEDDDVQAVIRQVIIREHLIVTAV
jgi:hemoglobin